MSKLKKLKPRTEKKKRWDTDDYGLERVVIPKDVPAAKPKPTKVKTSKKNGILMIMVWKELLFQWVSAAKPKPNKVKASKNGKLIIMALKRVVVSKDVPTIKPAEVKAALRLRQLRLRQLRLRLHLPRLYLSLYR